MKTLEFRVNRLLEKTTNEEVKNECKKVLELIGYNSDENVLRTVLLENIKKLSNLGVPEKQFIKNEEKNSSLATTSSK